MSSVGDTVVKKAIKDAGLYEEGMSLTDMADIYKAITQSEECASKDNEYRTLMSNTEKNCANMEKLKNITNETNENEIRKAKEQEKNNNTTITDTITDKKECKKHVKLTKKKRYKLSNILEEGDNVILNSNEVEEGKSNSCNADSDINNTDENHDIDVFSTTASNYKPFNIKSAINLNSPLYCHPTFIKMPYEKKSKIIFQYNMLQISAYKKYQSRSIYRASWGNSIKLHPIETSNGSIDNSAEDATDRNYSGDSSKDNEINSEDARKKYPRLRQMKRKTYNELSDDDDFLVNKKSKGSSSNQTKVTEETSEFDKLKSNTGEKSLTRYLVHGDSHDRTNKIFANLRKESTDNNISHSSSDDEILPNVHYVTADVHKEDNSRQESPALQCTNSNTPIENVIIENITSNNDFTANAPDPSKANNYDGIEVDDTISNISAQNFYGITNNESPSKLNKTKQKCPICQKLFSNRMIERHAAQCNAYEESNKNTDEGESTNSSSTTHLCSICDTFLMTEDVNEHSRKCMKKELPKKK